MNSILLRCTLLSLVSLAAFAGGADPGDDEFRFKTYGMVCNQCAYGVEQSLQHTRGVDDAIVDLHAERDINVRVIPTPGQPPAVEKLVTRIRDQSVSISRAEVTITGTLDSDGDGWHLVSGTERYRIDVDDESPDLKAYTGRQVTLEGIIGGLDDAGGKLRLIPRKLRQV